MYSANVISTQSFPPSLKVSCQTCFTRKHCLAGRLEYNQLPELEKIAKRRLLQKGQRLFTQGDSFRSLFVIQSGSIKAFVVSADGDEQITGFHFGGDLLSLDGLEDGEHTYCTEALETTSVCEYSFTEFERLTEKLPELKSQFFKTLGRELSREKKCMLALGRMHAEQRLAHFILDSATQMRARGQSDHDLLFSMSRTDIANYLGLAVETTSRLLSRFAAAHLINVKHRKLSVLDAVGLHHVASGGQPQLAARSA